MRHPPSIWLPMPLLNGDGRFTILSTVKRLRRLRSYFISAFARLHRLGVRVAMTRRPFCPSEWDSQAESVRRGDDDGPLFRPR
jgi:hypothetical protein